MKYRTVVVFMMAIPSAPVILAADCDIRASLIDIRDKALAFDPNFESSFRSFRGGPECARKISATNLANPRSKMTQEVVEGINSYSQKMRISQIDLQGQGALKFLSVDYNYGQSFYRLDIYISPGRIPKGASAPSSYYLAGSWLTFDSEGNLMQESNAFSAYEIADYQDVFLNWRAVSLNTKIELVVGNTVIPVRNYGLGGGYDTNSPFFPLAKTVGSLSSTLLVPQTSFLLSSDSTCRRLGEIDPVSCD